jgi:hypothetical protein
MDEDYTDEFPDFMDTPDDSDWDAPSEHDDMYDVESALGSAGFGTDEWYGCFESDL